MAEAQAALLEEQEKEYRAELEREERRRNEARVALQLAVAQPGHDKLEAAIDACEAEGLPEEELANVKQEFNVRIQRHTEELRAEDEKARAAFRAEQTQEHEVAELDGLIARADEAEMREWTTQEKRKHKAASKGGGAGAASKGGARLGLFREIRHPKE